MNSLTVLPVLGVWDLGAFDLSLRPHIQSGANPCRICLWMSHIFASLSLSYFRLSLSVPKLAQQLSKWFPCFQFLPKSTLPVVRLLFIKCSFDIIVLFKALCLLPNELNVCHLRPSVFAFWPSSLSYFLSFSQTGTVLLKVHIMLPLPTFAHDAVSVWITHIIAVVRPDSPISYLPDIQFLYMFNGDNKNLPPRDVWELTEIMRCKVSGEWLVNKWLLWSLFTSHNIIHPFKSISMPFPSKFLSWPSHFQIQSPLFFWTAIRCCVSHILLVILGIFILITHILPQL